MSSLIFETQPDMALVATDTLAVHPSGAPSHFTSKALLVPHLRMIIAGTGVAGFSSRWFLRVLDNMIVRGIEHLDYHAQGSLQNLWSEYVEELDIPEDISTTLYHFGVSEVSGEIVTFAYRSEKDFESERLGHGLRFKPVCDDPGDTPPPARFVEMMKSQRKLQEDVPPAQRVHIGGEIHLFVLTPSQTISARIHEFSDFDQVQEAIYSNFSSGR